MRRSIVAAVVVVAAVVSVLTLVQMPALSNAQTMGPCAEDMKTVCGDVTKGGGRLLRCYEERKDKISGDCRAYVEGAKMNAAALKEACSKELDARCTSEKGDPLEMLDCLQSNYIDLSMRCRDRLNEFKGRYPKPLN